MNKYPFAYRTVTYNETKKVLVMNFKIFIIQNMKKLLFNIHRYKDKQRRSQ